MAWAREKPKPARVVSNPEIMGGEPCVEGTRVPAGNILAEIRAGTPRVNIFRAYPSIPPDAIDAVIEWDLNGRPL
jgi:uncharacterized protein (DUF433 family)